MKKTAIIMAMCGASVGAALANISVTGNTTALPWDSATSVIIGNGGVGALTVNGGSALESNWSTVGAYTGGDGSATITGSGSSWTVGGGNGALRVGYNTGVGSVTVESGAILTSLYYSSLGHVANSTGTLTVDGATFNTTANYLLVGNEGNGNLYIGNGGVVNVTGFGNIARANGGSGFAEVSGAGSAWNLTGDLEVGRLDNGSLEIKDGGLVKVGGILAIDQYDGNNDAYVAMATGAQLALADAAGTGDDSIADFLSLVAGTDDIRYWNGSAWNAISSGTEGVDYTLAAGTGGLAGNAVLTVIPEPATLGLVVISFSGIFLFRKMQL